MIALVTKENKPRVIIFKGRVIMLKIGFTIRNRTDRTIPPMIYVANPPLTPTPSKTWDIRKRATE